MSHHRYVLQGAPLWPVQRQRGQWPSSTSRRSSLTGCALCASQARTIATSSSGSFNWRRAGAKAPGRFRIGARPSEVIRHLRHRINPTKCPVRFAMISAMRRQYAGVRTAWVVPSGRITSRSRWRVFP